MTEVGSLLRRATSTSAQVFAGASTALLPIAVQAIAARAIEIDSQATLALSISIGAFVTAIFSATVLETRLASRRSRPLSYVPIWSTAAGLIGCIAMAMGALSSVGFIVGAPLTMLALGIGRMHGVIARRSLAEGLAGLIMVAGVASALVLIHLSWQWAVAVLAISTACTIIVRATKQPASSITGPLPSEYTKVALETTVTASVPLILNILVFAILTSSEAVAFRMILSVLGILQPLLGFMRTRLLVERSVTLAATLGSASLVALATVVVAHLLGVLAFVLGPSWSVVSTATLVVACLWKIASIPPTLPFADLRRGGHLDALVKLRILTSTIFIVSGCLALSIEGSLLSLFLGLCIAESINALLYFLTAHRRSRMSAESLLS